MTTRWSSTAAAIRLFGAPFIGRSGGPLSSIWLHTVLARCRRAQHQKRTHALSAMARELADACWRTGMPSKSQASRELANACLLRASSRFWPWALTAVPVNLCDQDAAHFPGLHSTRTLRSAPSWSFQRAPHLRLELDPRALASRRCLAGSDIALYPASLSRPSQEICRLLSIRLCRLIL